MRARDRHTLAAIDLNLLVALDALLQEGSVTRAGRLLGLSQPAMSHALSKLRDLMGDPLLVREGSAMRPTELGRRITPEVRRLIGEIEATLLGHRAFEPSRSTRTFRLATNDYCGAVLLPSIVQRAHRSAPRATIEVHGLAGQAPVQALARGELDAALGTFLDSHEQLQTHVLTSKRSSTRSGETATSSPMRGAPLSSAT
jgi:DNA-binding transcriptional LysR family regulator